MRNQQPESLKRILVCPICRNDFLFKPQVNNFEIENEPRAQTSFLNHTQRHCIENLVVSFLYEQYKYKNHLVIFNSGCKDGKLFRSILLSLKWEGFSYTAIGMDPSHQGISKLKQKDPSVHWIMGSPKSIPLIDKSVDVILNCFSKPVFNEFNRILKEDGTIVKVISKTKMEKIKPLLEKGFNVFEKANRIEDVENEDFVLAYSDRILM